MCLINQTNNLFCKRYSRKIKKSLSTILIIDIIRLTFYQNYLLITRIINFRLEFITTWEVIEISIAGIFGLRLNEFITYDEVIK